MEYFSTFWLLCLPVLIWYCSSLPQNYRNARKSGLPFIFCPVSPTDPIWITTSAILGSANISRFFPRFLFDRVKWTLHGYGQFTKSLSNDYRSFVLVCPKENFYFIREPELVLEILARKKDFGIPPTQKRIMNAFGPNLLSSDNEDWQRYRRIIAPMLNERIMDNVWNESTTQAQDMLLELSKPTTNTKGNSANDTLDGFRTITMNVITSFCLGTRRSWGEKTSTELSPGFHTTLMTSLVDIIDNIVFAIFVPPKILMLPFMPKNAQKFSKFASLVRRAVQEKGVIEKSSKTINYLTDEEISGNLFNLIVAGFDTTANTLSYAVMFLALQPEWQDWIAANIDQVLELHPDGDYSTCFPHLTRCLALMFEVLRLFSPIGNAGRYVDQPQTVRDVYFSPGATIHMNHALLHYDPSTWGSDPFEFRPTRWLDTDKSVQTPGRESLIEPRPGTFLPWSAGPRDCPGRKMSEVEFISVIFKIFRKWKVEIVVRDGETESDAKKRLKGVIEDSSPKMTFQVNRPQDAQLKWVLR